MDADGGRLESLRRGLATLFADFTRDRPPWRARSVRWASMLVLLGIALAVRDTLSGRAPGLDALAWPLPLRVGLSYIGGFGVGWCMRRFRKLTLLCLLAVPVLFYALRLMGWEGGTWSSLEELIRSAIDGARAQADAVASAAKHALPSACIAGLGGILGWFHRARAPAAEEGAD